MQYKTATIVTSLLILLGSCQAQVNITGNWISVNAEKSATGSFTIRQFTITKDNWEVRATVYIDSSLTIPVFIFRASGDYIIEGQSENLPNTSNVVFAFSKKYITLKTKDTLVIRKFGLGKCSLVYLKESDITETGCAYFASEAVCAQEYDLVRKTGHNLFLGARPASGGMCEIAKRPTALGPPLKKVTEQNITKKD